MSGAGNRYHTELRKMLRLMRHDVDAKMIPIIKLYAPDYFQDSVTNDAWPDAVELALTTLRDRWQGARFQTFAKGLADTFVRQSLQEATRRNRRSFGIDIFQNSQKMNDYIKAAAYQNAQLIESIPERYLERVSNAVITNMRQGLRPSAIEGQLAHEYGVTQRHAKMIARDQTAKINGEMNRLKQQDAGGEYFKWVDVHDERVRHRHREIANADVGYGKGVYRWDDLPMGDHGVRIFPGSDYQCFPGYLPVNIFAGAKKLFRHWYRGKLTKLITDDGACFESTANHPVLTDRGFVPAQFINVGDNIIKVRKQAINALEGYSKSSNIEFSKLFESSQLIGNLCESVRALGGDFHGDIAINEDINIVSFNWELPVGFKSYAAKSFIEFLFSKSDEVIVSNNASSDSNLYSVVEGLTLAPDGIVRGLCKFLSISGGGFSHSDEHALTSIGLLYSSFIKNASDDISRGIEFFSDCLNTEISIEQRLNIFKRYMLLIGRFAFGLGDNKISGADGFANVGGTGSKFNTAIDNGVPLEYELITVVDKLFSEFNGHVYNLEMDNGLYISQDTAVSNCRCVARFIRTSVVEKHIQSREDKN